MKKNKKKKLFGKKPSICWIYKMLNEYKSINKAHSKFDPDNNFDLNDLLEAINNVEGFIPKALISYYMLAINNTFLKKTNVSPDFAINI